MRNIAIFALATMAAPMSAASATSAVHAVELHLICDGSGSAVKVESGTANVRASNGNSATVTGYSTYDRNFSDTVALDISGDGGRIRLPRTILPIVHGGRNGWMKLSNIEFSDTEIRATAKINFINNPRIILDRVAGSIEVTGKNGDFNGRCRAYDPQTATRQF